MNLTWRRRVIWLVLLLGLALALFLGFQPRPRLVDVAEVRRASLELSVEEEGKTRVIDRYVVSAPVAGTTCRTDLEVGSTGCRAPPRVRRRRPAHAPYGCRYSRRRRSPGLSCPSLVSPAAV